MFALACRKISVTQPRDWTKRASPGVPLDRIQRNPRLTIRNLKIWLVKKRSIFEFKIFFHRQIVFDSLTSTIIRLFGNRASKQSMTSQSNQFITPPTNHSTRSLGEDISLETLSILRERINVLELYFEVKETKVEKKKKAEPLAHIFNDDKEASFLVSW